MGQRAVLGEEKQQRHRDACSVGAGSAAGRGRRRGEGGLRGRVCVSVGGRADGAGLMARRSLSRMPRSSR